jgi:hypothetical protein
VSWAMAGKPANIVSHPAELLNFICMVVLLSTVN